MRKNTYYALLAGVIAVMVFVIGYAMTTGNPLIPAILIIAGIGIVYLGKQRVSDVMQDDLSDAIEGKAASGALLVTIVLATIIFAGTMTFYFNSGYGGGFHTFANGSVSVSFMHDAMIPGQPVYHDTYLIADPANPTGTDFWGLDMLFKNGHQAREFPCIFGIGMGITAVLLACLYAAFSYYYTRKYEE